MEFDSFLQQACPPLGLQWRKYRRRAARHRIDRRLKELGIVDYTSYLDLLRTDPAEAEGLADTMRVTVSRFFRDRACWIDLVQKALPLLLAEMPAGSTFRVWSAGCCGGEEPYTIALVWLEYLRPIFPTLDISILATDIDDSSLERASRGLYSEASLREAPPGIRDKWFRPSNGLWRIDESVGDLVRFENRNMMKDPLPSAIDLVLCRYLIFTYYRGERLAKAANLVHEALRPGGVLMTGSRESLNAACEDLFEPWPGSRWIYRKRGD